MGSFVKIECHYHALDLNFFKVLQRAIAHSKGSFFQIASFHQRDFHGAPAARSMRIFETRSLKVLGSAKNTDGRSPLANEKSQTTAIARSQQFSIFPQFDSMKNPNFYVYFWPILKSFTALL